jgi:hypothetical protein
VKFAVKLTASGIGSGPAISPILVDSKKRFFEDFLWNRFKNFDPRDMYTAVSEHVFPLAANAGRD